MADDDWGSRMQRMRPVIESWVSRTSGQSQDEDIHEGSSLAGDDRDFERFPVSNAVWHALITAVEHLDFFYVALSKSKAMYPAAYYTVLRAALLGSAQAVWILAPASRVERRKRTLITAITDTNEQRKVIQSLPVSTDEEKDERDSYIEKLKERLEAATLAGGRLGFDESKVAAWSLNATNVIEEAAKVGLDAEQRGYAMVLWCMSSGHVHGHAYTRLLQLDRSLLTRRQDGTLWGQATATLDQVGAAAAAAWLMTRKGWELYDQRRHNSRHP
ncbi:hypothetical protein HUF15_45360 [Streptomyces samsunensis]|uniref:hypothetical protein n=1 Tax=Streptomyces malaysiensis TaxID=92644 RepID=UPI001582BFFB|nr:hypothetical protein [Streptomyces samsunensis]NUH43828.1 hypothetical protein [Streptomyces samsunensis]